MPSALPFDNPIAYAHLQLRGGWKNVAITTGAYGGVAGALVLISLRLNPDNPAAIYSFWTGLLMGVQAMLLLLFGANVVGQALRTDVTSGMIESHRLMPVPGIVAVGGYIIGPSVQAVGMALATFVIGTMTTRGAGYPWERWWVPNLVLFAFSVFLWTVAVFTNLAAKNGFRWVVVVLIFGAISQGTIFGLFPGLLVIVSPLMRATVFAFATRGTSFDLGYLLAIICQVLIGLILYAGAARKFQDGNAPALSPLLGLMLLAAWVGTSVLGMTYWDEFRPFRMPWSTSEQTVQFLGSTLSSLIVAAIPISAAARLSAERKRRIRVADLTIPPATIPPLLCAVIASAFILLFSPFAAEPVIGFQEATTYTAITVVATLIGLAYVFMVMARRRARALFAVIAYLIVTWVGPLLVDFVRFGLGDPDQDIEAIGVASSASPVGALIRLWTGSEERPVPGVWLMVAITVALAFFYHSGTSKKKPAKPAVEKDEDPLT